MKDSEQRLDSQSLSFVEGLYHDYLHDPQSVSEDWRLYFDQLSQEDDVPAGSRLQPSFKPSSLFNPASKHITNGKTGQNGDVSSALQHKVTHLIRNYRVRGHIISHLDPLGIPRPQPPELDPGYYGFTENEMDLEFETCIVPDCNQLKLRDIISRLRNTYCRSIGVQFMHIDSLKVREWLQDRMEHTENRLSMTHDEQIRILTRLTDAVIFEDFVQKKYIGSKSFSLEGAESLIPLLELTIEKAGEHGIEEIVMGMAHRGRLNVLANIMGKSPRLIFKEFEDKDARAYLGRGDVKYHLGYHTDWLTQAGNNIHIALCFNPSHLEFVNPVALGRLRAKQDRLGDLKREIGLAILIHGDASFIGEGIIQESLNLSELRGYRTGGAIHVVVNNQIGFTTDPAQGRSSQYATDVAKMLQIPIFHVNGEDPEAVAQVVSLAMDFRRTFRRDVVIDMYCYRRRGHNESDEAAFTQPILYRAIKKRKSVRDGYMQNLFELGEVSRDEADTIVKRRRELLEKELSEARRELNGTKSGAQLEDHNSPNRSSVLGRIWQNYKGGPDRDVPEVPTAYDLKGLAELLEVQTRVPDNFNPHSKIKRFLELRREMAAGKKPLDWSAAEALAFASLAVEGYRVRLSGQDSQRGTFSHRHSVIHDVDNGSIYVPLMNLAPNQAPVDIYNSPLSEAGVLGFDYGYSIAYPDALVMWEAQFGDFSNAAQVIIDQFIASAEDKWRLFSGLVLLLPHGFEGTGPEHASARLERYLALAAEDNMQIANVTTPAQYFHILRRQVHRLWRKPLIIMTPKSLLRHPAVVSSLEDCAAGRFRKVIPDDGIRDVKKVDYVLMCSGKIYYELLEKRDELGKDNVPIIRIEQLYPFPEDDLKDILSRFPEETPVRWVQEEPENMGGWRYIKNMYCNRLFGRYPFSGIYRSASASPATGSKSSHKLEQKMILEEALNKS